MSLPCVLKFDLIRNMCLCISEDEQIPPLVSKVVAKSKWDDEDVDDSDVKESWEDDDEPTPV